MGCFVLARFAAKVLRSVLSSVVFDLPTGCFIALSQARICCGESGLKGSCQNQRRTLAVAHCTSGIRVLSAQRCLIETSWAPHVWQTLIVQIVRRSMMTAVWA